MQDITARLQTALEGRFRIERPLGEGGMAMVFLAQDLRHNRHVAVKVIRPELGEAVGAERFLQEIRVTASLVHPNIPPLLDSGEADGLLYYVMPFAEQATLRERIQAEGRLGIEEALTHTRELADALDYAHRTGLVHRDVKPSNVFLEDGHALLADFGVALIAESADTERLTSAESVIGTAEYMSPEQCTGSHQVDARSDIYSLGCLLYEMLGGEPPFMGRTRVAVVARQIAEVPPPVSMLRGDVPPVVDEIIRTCLSKAPGDRYGTAGELRDAVDVALHDTASGAAQRPEASGSRRGVAFWVLASVALVVALMVVFRPASVPGLNTARVVVFPLADRGGGADVGADVAWMIGNALVHSDPLAWIDGWERLTPEQRADPSLLSSEDARAIALDRGARHFITGGVVGAGDSVTVRLVLHDAEGDSVVGQSTATGHEAETTPDQLGLRAMVQLLPPLLDPGRQVDVSYLERRNPAAIALWIQADREYREARFSTAMELYRSATGVDSFLAFAALKGAQAASWSDRLEVAEDMLGLAIRHDSILPRRYRSYANALAAYSNGDGDEAAALYRDALAADPEWSEAWTGLAEVYWHLLPSDLGGADSAIVFFERAVGLDPGFVTPLVHLAEHALREGDPGRAGDLIERLEASRGEPLSSLDWLELMRLCAEAEPGRNEAYPPAAASVLPVLSASRLYATRGTRLDCAEAGFRWVLQQADLTRAERWVALLGVQSIMVVQGRNGELGAFLDQARAVEPSTNFLFALDVLAGADIEDRARAVDAGATSAWGPDYATNGVSTVWLLSVWNAYEGDVETLEHLLERMEVLRLESDDARAPVLADAVQGHYALAIGDTAGAIEIFSSLRSTSDPSVLDEGLSEPLAAERILLAQLLLATGDAERAYRVASIFDHPEPLIFVPFIARSLALRMQAAQALSGAGWTRRAQEAQARLMALGRQDLLTRETGGGSR